MEKRNPYLLEYEEQQLLRRYGEQRGNSRRGTGKNSRSQNIETLEPIVMRQAVGLDAPGRAMRTATSAQAVRSAASGQAVRSAAPGRAACSAVPGRAVRSAVPGQAVPSDASRQAAPGRRQHASYKSGSRPVGRSNRAAAIARRKRIVRRQRLAVGIWIVCILLVAIVFLNQDNNVSAANQSQQSQNIPVGDDLSQQSEEAMIQGFPVAVFSAHPYWKEDFLTPNEYSRPGDLLKEVTNLFVHYTANPGTSAAQNRSYFEQQKDTHESSVSAHFIIGYEGEIIQCVPLDEVAYAVQTRNQDSISIECCYLEKDGAFTQETYDSLIDLLAWLTQIYELDTDDILRHYDCGGKKCPIYYTEHEDAWERLKADVAEKLKKL